MIYRLTNEIEEKATILYNTYLLWLEFMDKKQAQHKLIGELNIIMNDALESFGGKRIFRYNWDNVFKKTRIGIAEDKLSNIKRVITTELHKRYNMHLNELWKQDKTIIGRRIQLSKTSFNHCNICKNLAGVYPISFEWTLWHPNCRCFQVPVYGKEGREVKIPNRAKKFIKVNESTFKNWKNEPYWLKELSKL